VFARGRIKLPCNISRHRTIVDIDSAFTHGVKSTIITQRHSQRIRIIANTGKHEIGISHRQSGRRRHFTIMLRHPVFSF